MEFNPSNHTVQTCIQGMAEEEKGNRVRAGELFLKAWNEAANDFEKYLSAWFVARHQETFADKLRWLETALHFALKINDVTVMSAYPSLYSKLAECYEVTGDTENAGKYIIMARLFKDKPADNGPFYHGTRADMKHGELLTPGGISNYQQGLQMNHIYFTANINGAGLAASLAQGEGDERVYIVEPTGGYENDPNVTDKKFPGNPTRSYRSNEPLKVIGEIKFWDRLSPEEIKKWREKLDNNKGEIIN